MIPIWVYLFLYFLFMETTMTQLVRFFCYFIFSIMPHYSIFVCNTGHKQLSSLDILSTTGLVNYFGKWTDLTEVKISPILLRKGQSKLALYGLSHIKDERLSRLFRDGKVSLSCSLYLYFLCKFKFHLFIRSSGSAQTKTPRIGSISSFAIKIERNVASRNSFPKNHYRHFWIWLFGDTNMNVACKMNVAWKWNGIQFESFMLCNQVFCHFFPLFKDFHSRIHFFLVQFIQFYR